jgi:hypothetical protein
MISRGNTTKNCELGDSLSTDSFGLGAVVFMQTILIKYLFKRSAKLSESFDMVLWGTEQAGEVSCPFKLIFTVYQTSLNKFLRGIIPI